MVISIVQGVLLDQHLVYQTDVLYILIIFFLRVNIALFNAHDKFIQVVLICLSDFLSEEPNSLEVAHMNCFLGLVSLVKHCNIEGLNVGEMLGNLEFRLESLLTFVTI
jgi:hypothetical protein